jgi:hypothetical protein
MRASLPEWRISPALSIQAVSAFDAEAVTAQVVMAARGADESSRRVCLQPPFILAAVPDAVFRPEHPPSSFAVEHSQVSDREPERAWGHAAVAPLIDKVLVADLGIGEGIDCHAESIARGESEAPGGGCRIPYG